MSKIVAQSYLNSSMIHLAYLATRAVARLEMAERNYLRMHKYFGGAFLVAVGLLLTQVTSINLLTLLSCLHKDNMSALNVKNYLTATKTLHAKFRVSTRCFSDQRIQLFIRSLKLNRPENHDVLKWKSLRKNVNTM